LSKRYTEKFFFLVTIMITIPTTAESPIASSVKKSNPMMNTMLFVVGVPAALKRDGSLVVS
jgi:hypothetical protein